MTGVTDNPNHPDIVRGAPDTKPVPQHDTYLVLSDEELVKGFVRRVRNSYIHDKTLGGCGVVTKMGDKLSETYARDPSFYGATYCVGCKMHRPVGVGGEFFWDGTNEKVGT